MKEYPKHEQTLGHILADKAVQNAGKPFLYFRDQMLTYDEVNRRADGLAAGLLAAGVRHGTNLAVMLPNCLEFLDVWFGLCKLGAIEVPINTAFRGYQLEYILNDSNADTLVLSARFLDRLAQVRANLTSLRRIYVLRDPTDPTDAAPIPSDLDLEVHPFGALQSDGRRKTEDGGGLESPSSVLRLPSVDYRDLMAILHTSGTTGPSKGVMVCHAHQYRLARNMALNVGLGPDDVYLNFYPFFHNTAMCLITYPVMLTDGAVVIVERFSASRFWDDVRRYGCTAWYFLGSMLEILCKAPPSPTDRDHMLRIGWGLAASAEQIAAFESRFGVPLLSGYGSTEANVVSYESADARRPGSCGKPWPDWDVLVFDEHDTPVPPQQTGEIAIRPRVPFASFLGYYNKPEATVAAWRNLWFHTGDAGYFDEDGYLYFVDRIKDVIRRRGENISSYDVETVVNRHPAVLESAAVAVKSELGEDEVKIVVVLKPDAQLAPAELIAHCATELAYFAVPRYVELKPALPRTPTDKVEKYKLRAEGLTPATWDREAAGIKLQR
ncbi:MAG: AMP-binding protein [Chloroflexi bacterium]|nr:AMP-binding protein [Chloroflexota bacterium]